MRVIVITPPDPVVTLEEAKAHLRVLDDDHDAIISAYIAAATSHIDGPGGWLGRAIGEQTLEARFDAFSECIRLPYPPVIELVSVKHLDSDGTEATVDSGDYELRGREIGTALGKNWPSTLTHPETVRVRYRAGFETLPAAIRAAILLMTGDMFSFRETATERTASEIPMSTTVDALLAPFKVWA